MRLRTGVQVLALVFTSVLPAVSAAQTSSSIPELRRWEAQMLSFGRAACRYLGETHTGDELLGHVYYDGQRVFLQIAHYTRDDTWLACAERARIVYRDRYVASNKGGVPGYWNFTDGLTMDYLRTGDAASKQAVLLLAHNAAFARDGTPLESTKDAKLSREVAYTILSYLNAERVGGAPRPRLRPLVDQALGHIDQWFGRKTAASMQPFMVGLTLEALIAYHGRTADRRIPAAVKTALDGLWEQAWVARDASFWYESTDKSAGAPDLNLLIAPAYAWFFRHSGDDVYRERGDKVFAGGVTRAFLARGKQFNQSYRWSFDYAKWRAGTHEGPAAKNPDTGARRQAR